MSAAQNIFNCPLCADFQATEFKLLLPHIRLVHSTRPGFSIQCSIENCSRFFTNMKTYTNHIYSDHASLPKTASDYQCSTITDHGDLDDCEDENQQTNSTGFPPQFESTIACWILKIKECCKLTQFTTEVIIERVTDLNQYILSQVFLAVKEVMAESVIDVSKELQGIFDPNGRFGRPFKPIENAYKLQKYCKENFRFVVSYTQNPCIYIINNGSRNHFLLSWVLLMDGKGMVEKENICQLKM